MAAVLTVMLAGGCATSPGRRHADGELKALTEAGLAAYERGQMVKAAAIHGQAYRRGLLVDEWGEAGRNAYNAAMCHMALGEMAEAGRLLGEARRLLVRDEAAMARVELAEAELAVRAGNREVAGGHARRVLEGRAGAPERCQAALLLAETALTAGDREAVLSWFKVVRGAGGKGLAPLLAARREALEARLIEAGWMTGAAGERYLSQAAYLREGGAYGEMAEALMRAGEALKAARQAGDAFDAYERAVNTFTALGDKAGAARGVAGAESAAAMAGGAGYPERVRLLRAAAGNQGR
jgi:tetratricopeptide (TPR) repeat protein